MFVLFFAYVILAARATDFYGLVFYNIVRKSPW